MNAVRVVITGGTGFLGRRLVRSLTERGDEVVIFSRGSAPADLTGNAKVEVAQWTPTAEGDWQKTLDGVDAVVHLAGANVMDERWSPDRKKVLEESRILSGRLLAEGMARAKKKPSVYITGSGVGYYGMRSDDVVCDESSGPGTDYLAKICEDWEAAAKPASDAGIRTAAARIGVVFGAEAEAYKKIVMPYKMFVGGPIAPGTQWFAWIHIVDWVRAMEFVIDGSISGPFNVSAPEPVTQNGLAHDIGHALGRPAIFKVPETALRMMLGSDRAEVLITGQRAVPKKLSDAGFAFVYPDLKSALADLVSA